MKDRTLVQIAFYAALIGALGLLPQFAIPFLGGVPITAQSLGIMLAGVMLGPVRGALAVLLFLFVVALGAPLLAGGRGGLGVFAGPTVGFLIGWPIGAFVAGLIMARARRLAVLPAAALAAAVGGIGVVYLFGIPGISLVADLPLAKAALGSAIYIPGDLIKVAITAVVAQTVARGLPAALVSRS
ncbi:biotin transporter BioY [Polymorphum gilvum]|uniref:Biotin transporter n=1 Tax=Polymorphum gilvum (strain LMG 25793 / CGMCC 1.9160 / SL003B-26A1) TaxID=991905 RepID=F2J4U0_POLGS|nr:BioY family transporter [Polymorphum gilvum]ADZ69032.1 BioY family [Polymorphum gilvum SL003B-26A1]